MALAYKIINGRPDEDGNLQSMGANLMGGAKPPVSADGGGAIAPLAPRWIRH
jgi:hypothetical protein